MKKSLFSVTLAALLVMTLLTGCYSDRTFAETTIATGAPENNTISTEASSAATETKPAEAKRISRDEAKATAISHANVAKDKVRDFDIELEKERGVTFYEISFDVERMEYEYAIEAYTGEILYNRSERDR